MSAATRRRDAPPATCWLGCPRLAALAILWPLGLTHRILAGVDALTYFTPYWAYRMAELRAGRIPLWNPHLFFGVPFLANIQAAVLYPLHWPLIWLPAERALVWSAILHVWLAAALMYALARRTLRLTPAAGFLAGIVFGLGGFTLARVENINQLNGLAWLPGLLWLADETARAASGHRAAAGASRRPRHGPDLLAGHTQTTFREHGRAGAFVVLVRMETVAQERRGRRDGETRRRGDTATRRTGNERRRPAGCTTICAVLAVIPAMCFPRRNCYPRWS